MPQVAPDADGVIRLAEFVALNATVDGDDAAVVEDLRLAFGSLDVDGSGAMSSTERACTRPPLPRVEGHRHAVPPHGRGHHQELRRTHILRGLHGHSGLMLHRFGQI
jgi:hypothetical protein